MSSRKKIILEISEEVKKQFGEANWKEVSIRLGKEYGIVMTPNSCRSAAYRFRKESGEIEHQETNKNLSIEIRKDGTQVSERIIQMSEKDMKDESFILKAHGFDPEKFKLINAKNNFWKTQTTEKELFNYQSKVVVEPKRAEHLSIEDIESVMKEIKPFPLIKLKEETQGGYALELDLADVHLGALSWHEETGEDNDYKITFGNMEKVISQASEIINKYPIEKLYLCFLGDFFHIDTESMTTTKGTKVDFDSRPKKMLMKGYELVTKIIDNLAIVPTEVIWIEGNHSRNLEFSVFYAMPFIYARNPHIKFDVSPKLRKAFMYGNSLIGLHHGEINKNNKFNWLQVEFRELWGKAKYAETHSGHIHHESVTGKGGIIERSNPTMKPVDKYEYEEGYVGSEKAVMAYLWTKNKGIKEIHYLK